MLVSLSHLLRGFDKLLLILDLFIIDLDIFPQLCFTFSESLKLFCFELFAIRLVLPNLLHNYESFAFRESETHFLGFGSILIALSRMEIVLA